MEIRCGIAHGLGERDVELVLEQGCLGFWLLRAEFDFKALA